MNIPCFFPASRQLESLQHVANVPGTIIELCNMQVKLLGKSK